MRVFENMESEVRGYIRSYPTVFERAKGCELINEQGEVFVDFFAGAGTLNYGHNNDAITAAMIDYLQHDGIVHGLDMATTAKKQLIQAIDNLILKPRNLDYVLQFTGPTGTNAVETALKLARLVKGRSNVVAFTNGYHGLTQGSLAITGNNEYRDESYISRINVTFMPYDGYLGDMDTLEVFSKSLADGSSGMDLPAAVIVETVQGEGGINIASAEWLKGLAQLCHQYDVLLIIDDIQVGNGRTGDFFSFEFADIKPDVIALSKSIGGGLPMSLLLFRKDLDQWRPGEHTGTFRGNNLAFVACRVALEQYWANSDLSEAVHHKGRLMGDFLRKLAERYKDTYTIDVRGRGMVYGFDIKDNPSFAGELSAKCFEENLIIETCGSESQVVKFLPPLVISEEQLMDGLNRFATAMDKLVDCKHESLTNAL